MNTEKRNKLLSAADATRTYPTTRAGIERQLEQIAAGKGGRKPTTAHPLWDCLSRGTHTHWSCGRITREYGTKQYERFYGERVTCEQYRADKLKQVSA
jgi:hypothetical protein